MKILIGDARERLRAYSGDPGYADMARKRIDDDAPLLTQPQAAA